jgi:hypothetical protein
MRPKADRDSTALVDDQGRYYEADSDRRPWRWERDGRLVEETEGEPRYPIEAFLQDGFNGHDAIDLCFLDGRTVRVRVAGWHPAFQSRWVEGTIGGHPAMLQVVSRVA